MIRSIHIGPLSSSLLIACLLGCLPSISVGDEVSGSVHETVPMSLEQGRPLVELTIVGPEGKPATVSFLVDTGGGAFMIPEAAARAAGIDWTETFRAEGAEFARATTPPVAMFGDYALPLQSERILIVIGQDPGAKSTTGLLPGHVLAAHHVIFDYPGATLTLASPGSLESIGAPVPMPVSSPMGFPRTEIRIAGQTYGMLLDTGPPATMISEALMNELREQQPDWIFHPNPWGEAEALASLGGQVLATLVVDDIEWGGHGLEPLTTAAQRRGVFEQYMSRMMTEPVIGALGSNAFMEFRLELDYRNQTLYLSRPDSD